MLVETTEGLARGEGLKTFHLQGGLNKDVSKEIVFQST